MINLKQLLFCFYPAQHLLVMLPAETRSRYRLGYANASSHKRRPKTPVCDALGRVHRKIIASGLRTAKNFLQSQIVCHIPSPDSPIGGQLEAITCFSASNFSTHRAIETSGFEISANRNSPGCRSKAVRCTSEEVGEALLALASLVPTMGVLYHSSWLCFARESWKTVMCWISVGNSGARSSLISPVQCRRFVAEW